VCNTVPLVLFLYRVKPNSPISLNGSTHKIPFVNAYLCDYMPCINCGFGFGGIGLVHSFGSLSYDRPKASSKASFPRSAI